jgi:glycyl-tRNA synthetase (class II)
VPAPNFDVIVSLAKRRGFVFPSSEIYGGMAGFWDYGPLGVELKNNVKAAWWRHMVHLRDDVVGIDASIIMNPKVWEASGHVAGFSDPMVDCRNCKHRFRQDELKGPPAEIACPNCGNRGTLTDARQFNLMFATHVGPVADSASIAYLRPETAQAMFVQRIQPATSLFSLRGLFRVVNFRSLGDRLMPCRAHARRLTRADEHRLHFSRSGKPGARHGQGFA